MIIPLSTELRLRRTPIVTLSLVVLAVAVFVVIEMLKSTDPELALEVLSFGQIQGGRGFHWWGLFSSALLHAGWVHLLGNMVFLWVFGPSVENRFGHLGFLLFYLAGAAASGGAHAIVEQAPAIGASGAIAGVTGAFIVLFPQTRIRCLWLFGLTIVHAPAWWVIGLNIAWNLLAAGLGADHGVAHVAHLAGYVFGIGVTMLLLWLRVFPRESYDLVTAIRQAHRRRQLRSATAEISGPTRPERALKTEDDAQSRAVAEARAEVSKLMGGPDLAPAAAAYREFVTQFAGVPVSLLTLPRNMQYDLATWLYGQGRYAEAVEAFERLVEIYPKDPEVNHIRLLIARAYIRRLDRANEAMALLDLVIEHALDDQLRTMAQREKRTIEVAAD